MRLDIICHDMTLSLHETTEVLGNPGRVARGVWIGQRLLEP